jgi:hypothetical protein
VAGASSVASALVLWLGDVEGAPIDHAEHTILDRTEQGKQLIELDVLDVHVMQDVSRKGLELIRCLH